MKTAANLPSTFQCQELELFWALSLFLLESPIKDSKLNKTEVELSHNSVAEGKKCGENENVFFSKNGREEKVTDREDKLVELYIILMGDR